MPRLPLICKCLCLSIIGTAAALHSGPAPALSQHETQPVKSVSLDKRSYFTDENRPPELAQAYFVRLVNQYFALHPKTAPRVEAVSTNPANAGTFWVASTMAAVIVLIVGGFVMHNAVAVGALALSAGAFILSVGLAMLFTVGLLYRRIQAQKRYRFNVVNFLWWLFNYLFDKPRPGPLEIRFDKDTTVQATIDDASGQSLADVARFEAAYEDRVVYRPFYTPELTPDLAAMTNRESFRRLYTVSPRHGKSSMPSGDAIGTSPRITLLSRRKKRDITNSEVSVGSP
ncbi:hypothetical protein SeLEV6574_g08235 [Synchytrium endobioticum]|nr:hypothetical protein SeLEV6574_g08235 [Synchytrium endobioticum]